MRYLLPAIFILWLLVYLMPDQLAGNSHKSADTADKDNIFSIAMMACRIAQDKVRDTLKAPATAEFPSCSWSLGSYEIRTTADLSRFFVKGHVDAENSFGAKIRNRFFVVLDRNAVESEFSDRGWSLKHVSMIP